MAREIDDNIRRKADDRGITRLCHFTRLETLSSIADQRLILSNDSMRRMKVDYVQNDRKRLDGHLGYVCCSIGYPNLYFLNSLWRQDSVSRREDDDPFVVLTLYLDPIWWKCTRFSPRNAAKGEGRNIGSGESTFDGLFEDIPGVPWGTREQSHLKECPTDLQAEVLVKSGIAVELITSVVLADSTHADLLADGLMNHLNPQANLIACPKFFDKDRVVNSIRAGRNPITNADIECLKRGNT